MIDDDVNEYDYDLGGNRDTGATYVRNYADDADTNQLETDGTWEYTYDDEGNLTKKSQGAYDETWIYGYDHANHLIRAEKWSEDPDTMGTPVLQMEAEYRYDVYGNRIEKDVDKDGASVTFSNVVTRFAIDGWNPTKPSPIGNENYDVFADLNGSSSLTTRYLRGDAVDQLLARIDASDTRWHLNDHLGSVRDIVDNTGTSLDSLRYDSFGNIASETADAYRGRYAFTGREFDVETQLQYNRARYYDATTGRWISQDPMGFDAGDSNLYRYVSNTPLSKTDPSGLVWTAGGVAEHLGGSDVGNAVLKAIQGGFVTVHSPLGVFAWFQTPKRSAFGVIQRDDTGQVIWGAKQKEIWGAYEHGGHVYIPSTMDDVEAALTILHEVTHALQEWEWNGIGDKAMQQKFAQFAKTLPKGMFEITNADCNRSPHESGAAAEHCFC